MTMLKTNQCIRTGAVTSLLGALVLFVYACEPGTISSPVAPNTAAAKGGKPGKPGGGSPTLTEYWIYQDDGNVIHVAGTGNVDEVNPRVALDHFFNGGRDDDFSDHFEYGLGGPLVATTEASATGGWHVDIPWNGSRSQTAGTTFLDAAITSIESGHVHGWVGPTVLA